MEDHESRTPTPESGLTLPPEAWQVLADLAYEFMMFCHNKADGTDQKDPREELF